jgi:hypothetical protein
MVRTTTYYERAVAVPGLSAERQAALVAHIVSRNQALAGQPQLPRSTARCAAALLAADPEGRLSGPTALAQAELLARLPLGRIVDSLQTEIMTLGILLGRDRFWPSGPRDALCVVLEHVRREVGTLLDVLRR